MHTTTLKPIWHFPSLLRNFSQTIKFIRDVKWMLNGNFYRCFKVRARGKLISFFCARRTLFSTESDDKEIEIHV